MKILKAITCIMASMSILTSCGSGTQTEPKYLVLYYSQTGATQVLAQLLHEELGADIDSIVVENPYSGTYQETIERCLQEREEGVVPVVKSLNVNPNDYDVIFLAYPIWFGTCAPPVQGLVKEYDFAGKKVVPICSFGSGGLESSSRDLKAALPEAEILEGYGVRNARIAAAPKELERFLIEMGYKEGEVEALPEYSAQAEVSEEEVAIFDAACGSYMYPLGTPQSVAKRETSEGTDYVFKALSGEATNTIYVTVSKEEGKQPEFTKVVRKE